MLIWPIPILPTGLEEFSSANTVSGFNSILASDNHKKILENKELFDNWIVPNAVNLFCRVWFDKAKWKQTIDNRALFPLFSMEEKLTATESGTNIDSTVAGRAAITCIINKTRLVLEKYFQNPKKIIDGNYIVKSVRNEFIKQKSNEYGYKQVKIPLCPNCLAIGTYKTALIKNGDSYICPRCSNEETHVKFGNIIGITCVCPSDSCHGKFIPVEFSNAKLRNFGTVRGFIDIPELSDSNFNCPFCSLSFVPKQSRTGSGFKGMGGYFTGLPNGFIWKRKDCVGSNKKIFSRLAYESKIEGYLANKQKIEILTDELLLKMSKLPNTLTGLVSTCFYSGIIEWMKKHPEDAIDYFFGKLKNKKLVHGSIFHSWVTELEANINKFKKFKINSLYDFNMFNKKPVVFVSELDSKNVIKKCGDLKFAKILSIRKFDNNKWDTYNYTKDIIDFDWQNIKMNSNLQPSNIVKVKAMVISNFRVPIQRVLRLRKILQSIIIKISSEEQDVEYWKNRKILVESAKTKLRRFYDGRKRH